MATREADAVHQADGVSEPLDVLAATDAYLVELAAEVGEPSARDAARAQAMALRISERRSTREGR